MKFGGMVATKIDDWSIFPFDAPPIDGPRSATDSAQPVSKNIVANSTNIFLILPLKFFLGY